MKYYAIIVCSMELDSWKSPYQSREYWSTLAKVGVEYDAVTQSDGGVLFFDLTEQIPTAWESTRCYDTAPSISDISTVYQICKPSTDMHEDSYYTLALSSRDARFNKRYQRQVRRAFANLSNPTIKLAETPRQIDEAINLFAAYPDRRDNLPLDIFERRIKALVNAGLLLAYMLDNDNESLGASLVLRTDSQVNLRYYSATRDMSAGHLLHFLSIEDMFTERGIETIDLSGISPSSTDKKLRGIDEFKYQIGGTPVEFRRINAYIS